MDIADEAKFVEAIAGKVAAKLKKETGDENREFLLHLYDALWENTRAKEGRLWTFLSLYGAAVALVFAGGEASQAPGADLLALAIVTALSTWAVLIIINANWWYYRNQLMVSQIEAKYPEAVKGLVPKSYFEDPKYRFDKLYKGSIWILSLLLLLLYLRTLWTYHMPESIVSVQSLMVVIVVYCIFVLSGGYCLRLHESIIEAYYDAKRDLLKDEAAPDPLSPSVRLRVIEDEVKARKENDARIYVFLLLAIVVLVFDFVVFRNGVSGVWLIGIIALQIIAAFILATQGQLYRQPYSAKDRERVAGLEATNAVDETTIATLDAIEEKIKFKLAKGGSRKFWFASWHMVLLMSVSGVIAIWPLYQNNIKVQEDWKGAKSASYGDLSQQISKMQQDLQTVQASFNQLQQSNLDLQKRLLDEKLAPYQGRQEAEERFLTRDEFNRFVDSQIVKKPVTNK